MRISRAAALFTCLCVALTVTACGQAATQQPNSSVLGAYLYGADGNMNTPFGTAFWELSRGLLGMEGPRPGTAAAGEVQARPPGEGLSLTDFNFARGGFDAVVIAALAAQVAGTTDPGVVKQHINGVTVG